MSNFGVNRDIMGSLGTDFLLVPFCEILRTFVIKQSSARALFTLACKSWATCLNT